MASPYSSTHPASWPGPHLIFGSPSSSLVYGPVKSAGHVQSGLLPLPAFSLIFTIKMFSIHQEQSDLPPVLFFQSLGSFLRTTALNPPILFLCNGALLSWKPDSDLRPQRLHRILAACICICICICILKLVLQTINSSNVLGKEGTLGLIYPVSLLVLLAGNVIHIQPCLYLVEQN